MATLASPSSSPPPTPLKRRTKSCARRCERVCCTIATYFPLAFVYSLTTWAAWVEAGTGLRSQDAEKTKPWLAKVISLIGVILYLLLNTSYTVAVFTDPGSPTRSSSKRNAKYSSLPTSEPTNDIPDIQPITVSSTGSQRYCKKCHTTKPDRTHHCSTCRRCVLKMDHHCPWLATCVGLHNYKAFVLFLIYTSLFCWICFLSSARWVWIEVFSQNQFLEEFAPVNVIMLAVISGIIGLVLTGFTGWHLYLCMRGQTTIECLEKTRYLSGVRRQVERQRQDQMNGHARAGSHGVAETLQRAGEQILEFHANAVPGATRVEEGEEHTSPVPSVRSVAKPTSQPRASSPSSYADSPAQQALRRTYSAVEEQRERDRYDEYLDDKESEKLPNAFDLGWRRNLAHLFGPNPFLWFLPVCNTTGDGWRWEVSPKWVQASEEAARRRARGQSQSSGPRGGGGYDGAYERDLESGEADGSGMSMRPLQRPGRAWAKAKQRREFEGGEFEGYEVSSDEDTDDAWEGGGHAQRETDGHRDGDRGWRRWE